METRIMIYKYIMNADTKRIYMLTIFTTQLRNAPMTQIPGSDWKADLANFVNMFNST